MSEAFDPYLHWLGIRDPQRPPNYYRLLGVDLFESDPDVLSNAADRQMAHVRTFQTGPRSAESQRILNELAAAKVCLLNPQKKAAYDARLRAEQQSAATPVLPPALPPRAVEPPSLPAPPGPPGTEQAPAARSLAMSVKISGLVAAVVVLVALIVLYGGGESPQTGSKIAAVIEQESRSGPEEANPPPSTLSPIPPGEKPGTKTDSAAPDPSPQPQPEIKPKPGPGESKPVPLLKIEKPAPPEVKPAPQPMPGPGDGPKTKPAIEPVEEPLDLRNPPPLAQSLASARSALRQRDPAAALRHLALAEKVAYPKDRPEVENLRTVVKLLDTYWKSVRAGLRDLKPGQRMEVGGTQIEVVESSEDSITLLVGGDKKQYPLAKFPPALADALTQRNLPQLPASVLARAAFHALDPAGDPKRAAGLIEQAAAEGLPTEELSAEWKRALPGGAAPTPVLDSRLSVPSKPEQDAARKQVREVFRDNYAAAQKPAEKGSLAQTLVRQAVETRDNPAARFVLLAEARDMALAAGDAALLRRAVSEMAKDYQVEAAEEYSRVLTEATEGAMPSVVRKGLARAAIDLASEALARDDFDHAVRLSKTGHTLATKARDGATARQAADLAASVPWFKQQHELAQQAEKALAKDPENSKAHLALGVYWALIKNDWTRGLPLLAKGSDPALKALAEAELGMGKATATDAVKLADQWNAAAASVDDALRPAVHRRALAWYEKALPRLSGFTKTRVERLVQELKEADPARRRP